MGALHRSLLCGRQVVRNPHARRSSSRKDLGLRSSVFYLAQRSCWRRLAGKSGPHHGLSPAYAGGLCEGLHQEIVSVPGLTEKTRRLYLPEPEGFSTAVLRSSLATMR